MWAPQGQLCPPLCPLPCFGLLLHIHWAPTVARACAKTLASAVYPKDGLCLFEGLSLLSPAFLPLPCLPEGPNWALAPGEGPHVPGPMGATFPGLPWYPQEMTWYCGGPRPRGLPPESHLHPGGEGGSLLSHTYTWEERGAPFQVTPLSGRRGGLPPKSHLRPVGQGCLRQHPA